MKLAMRGDQVFIACTDIPEYCKTLDYEVFEIDEGKALSAT